jgi:hypothetical protein
MTDNYLQLRPKGLQASFTESFFLGGAPPHAREVITYSYRHLFKVRSQLQKLLVVLISFAFVCVAPAIPAQDETAFPSDAEVQLLATQAQRAVQQYKPLIDEQKLLSESADAESLTRDREVVQALDVVLNSLKQNPQGFNGPVGFAFLGLLNDGGRNALVCSTVSMGSLSQQMTLGNTKNKSQLIHLSESCMDASTLFYTVSENAGSLYERYVKAEQALAQKGFKVAERCTAALKQMAEAKKQ